MQLFFIAIGGNIAGMEQEIINSVGLIFTGFVSIGALTFALMLFAYFAGQLMSRLFD